MSVYNNYDRNAASVADSLASERAEYSGLTTTCSFSTAASPNGGATPSAVAGSEYGEVDTSGVVSHYIPAKANYKIVLWRFVGNTGTGGQASTIVTFESPKGSTFYEVGRVVATISTAAAFEVPLVATDAVNVRQPLAIGYAGATLKIKLAVASISACPITVFFSYVPDVVSTI